MDNEDYEMFISSRYNKKLSDLDSGDKFKDTCVFAVLEELDRLGVVADGRVVMVSYIDKKYKSK